MVQEAPEKRHERVRYLQSQSNKVEEQPATYEEVVERKYWRASGGRTNETT